MNLYEVLGPMGQTLGYWSTANDVLSFSQVVFREVVPDERKGDYVAVIPAATEQLREFKVVGLLAGGGWGDTGYTIRKR